MIFCHSLAGTRSSRAGLRAASLAEELVRALAFWSCAFWRSLRALFFPALAVDFGSGDTDRGRFLGVTCAGVSVACFYLSSSALERASFQSCLLLSNTSTKAAEKLVNFLRWSELTL